MDEAVEALVAAVMALAKQKGGQYLLDFDQHNISHGFQDWLEQHEFSKEFFTEENIDALAIELFTAMGGGNGLGGNEQAMIDEIKSIIRKPMLSGKNILQGLQGLVRDFERQHPAPDGAAGTARRQQEGTGEQIPVAAAASKKAGR